MCCLIDGRNVLPGSGMNQPMIFTPQDEPAHDIHNQGGLPNQLNRLMDHSLPCLLLSWLHNLLHAARRLQVGQMRAALKEVWQRLLWTTLYDKQHVRHPRGGCHCCPPHFQRYVEAGSVTHYRHTSSIYSM